MGLFQKIYKDQLAHKNYLKYALGEVLFIIAGVLLALQVDSWRENLVNRQKEENYLTLLKNDLDDQLQEIDLQVASELEILRDSEQLIKSFNNTSRFIVDDAYASSLGNINNWRTFIKINPAYEQLLATGHVELIINQDVRRDIFGYYHQLRKVEAIIIENHAYIQTTFTPFILTISEHSLPNFQSSLYGDIIKKGYIQKDVGQILSGNANFKGKIQELVDQPDIMLQLSNAIKFRYRISAVHLSYLENLRQKTELLKEQINMELKR